MTVIEMKEKKPFIPRDKPKSMVLVMISALGALLVAGPLALIGHLVEIDILFKLGWWLFLVCWFVLFIMILLNWLNALNGKYDNIEEKDWNEQVW